MIINLRRCRSGIYQIQDVYLLLAVVAISTVKDVVAQSSTLDGPSRVDEGEDATFTCTPTGGTLRRIEWRNSSFEETTDITLADIIIRHDPPSDSTPIDRDPLHYTFDSTAPGYPLTIKSVTLDDVGTYWCRLNIIGPGNVDKNKQMKVTVKPHTMIIKDLLTGKNYTTGGEPARVIAGLNRFMCIVPGVTPEASFNWTLNSEELSGSVETNVPNDADPRLIDSSSSQNVTILGDNTTSLILSCSAHNKQDGTNTPEQTVTITLQLVKDPCQPPPCNEGTCTPTATLDGYTCDCPEGTDRPNCKPVPTTPPPEPTQPTGTDGKPTEVPTTPPEPTQPTGTDGKPTEATDQPLSVAAIAGISCGCVLAGLCLIGIGIYLCYTYDCCIWCGEHCPWCREHCSCCRKPPKDGGNRDENIGMNNTGDERH